MRLGATRSRPELCLADEKSIGELVERLISPGIGLSVARRIVESHGGYMSVESAVGHGSTFSLWLPMRIDASTAAPVSNASREFEHDDRHACGQGACSVSRCADIKDRSVSREETTAPRA
jgi:hypothetical protein